MGVVLRHLRKRPASQVNALFSVIATAGDQVIFSSLQLHLAMQLRSSGPLNHRLHQSPRRHRQRSVSLLHHKHLALHGRTQGRKAQVGSIPVRCGSVSDQMWLRLER